MFDQTQLKETKLLFYNGKKRLENIIEGTNVGTLGVQCSRHQREMG